MRQRRTRIVNFRVTEQEYDLLRSASLAQGLSAYARRAALSMAQSLPKEKSNNASPEFVLSCLSELRCRVAELESRLGILGDESERTTQETCA